MEYVRCELCGSGNCRDIFAYGNRKVVQCRQCGLIYKNPRLSGEELAKKYAEDEYSPGNREKLSRERRQIYEYGLAKMANISEKGMMLDIGCGYGEFLSIARVRGWQVQGLELSKTSSAFTKDNLKIPVFNGTLTEAKFNTGSFDAVTMWDVLDQLTDPQETLEEIYRILKPKGLLFLRVRNADFHINAYKIFKTFHAMIHEYSFSRNTVRQMMTKAGFGQIRVTNARLSSKYPFSFLFEFPCNVIFLISFGRAVLAPSMIAFGRKAP